MKLAWDETKNSINQRKHQVSFETAQLVFDDPLHVSKQDRIENGEQRWQTIGLVHGVVLLLVAHTHIEADGEETIRIISARKADKAERRIYAEAH
ncbi:MAG: BrnT family toxin [Sulfuricella sp.]